MERRDSFIYDDRGDPKITKIILLIVGFLFIFWFVWLFIGPQYNVWQKGLLGQSELKQAEWNRQIAVRQAEAQRDSASLQAEAEVLRAEGVAKANKIVAEGLGGPEGYLRYLYIHMLEGQQNQIIYIPTEAGLPILEAGKR